MRKEWKENNSSSVGNVRSGLPLTGAMASAAAAPLVDIVGMKFGRLGFLKHAKSTDRENSVGRLRNKLDLAETAGTRPAPTKTALLASSTESGKVNSLSLSRLGRLSDVKLGFSRLQYSQGPLHGEDG